MRDGWYNAVYASGEGSGGLVELLYVFNDDDEVLFAVIVDVSDDWGLLLLEPLLLGLNNLVSRRKLIITVSSCYFFLRAVNCLIFPR